MDDLLDYRRRVAEMYSAVRQRGADPAVCAAFRRQRDDLFHSHAQSPLDEAQKNRFTGLPYYAYDPAYRLIAPIDAAVEPEIFEMDVGEDGVFKMRRFGQVHFTLPSGAGNLSLFWIMGYGGGLFLPFGDATNGETTYGGGRYLFDTIKGADLGGKQGELVLDFNYAYHPSCAYHARWVCPLSPPENKLSFPVPAGEKLLTMTYW